MPRRRPVGDAKEIEALREIFGSGEKCPPIAATKSLTGHSLGATGVQEAIYSILMMQNEFISANAHITELDPEFSDMPISTKRRDNAKIGLLHVEFLSDSAATNAHHRDETSRRLIRRG